MSMFLFYFGYFIDIYNIGIMKVNILIEIKNKLFIHIKNNVETNKLVKDNKESHAEVKFYSVKFISARRIKKSHPNSST